jgi:cell wall-associated NlpC family hydrolase
MRSAGIAAASLALVCAGLTAGCASTGAVPRPFPAPAGTHAPPPSGARPGERTPSADRPGTPGTYDTYALVGTALALRGAPYRNGGSDPMGFDCSGFTQYVFAQHGIDLPRASRDQYRLGRPVAPRDLAPGDLVFFTTTEPGASHVAIVIGGDEFVHAPSSSGVVRVERLSAPYWSGRYVGARRLDPGRSD